MSSMKILLSASLEAAAVSAGKSLAQEAVAHVGEVYFCPRAQEALHELLRAHFQREDGDRPLVVYRHVLGDVHGERGFAHGRTRGDDDHFGLVQAVGHFIELRQAG